MNYKIKLAIQYIILGVLSVSFFYTVKISDFEVYRIEFVLDAIITTATTISGFVLTSLSILLGLSGNPALDAIKKNKLMGELVWRYAESLLIGLVIIISCIILGATLVETTAITFVPPKWIKAGICALVWYLVSLFFLCKYLLKILLYSPVNKVTVDNTPGEPNGDYRI